jgi:hypothetical protein
MICIALTIPIACQVWARGIEKKDITVSIGIIRVRRGFSAKPGIGFKNLK